MPLATEIDFVRRYVDLQRARFADRLDIRWHVDPAALAVPVPTLLLQPLVENAIRHGTAPQSRPSAVTITASVDGARLRLRVSDDGAGLRAGFELSRDAGTGLSNTVSRMHQLYGSRASFGIAPAEGGGTVAEVLLPSVPVVQAIRTIA